MRRPGRSIAALASCVCVFVAPPAASQKPQFRTDVELVVVDVLVTDHGKPVVGLQAEDFELRDEDVPQRVALLTTAENVSVILSLDTSGSIAGDKLQHLKRACHTLIAALRPGDSASLLSFSRPIELLTAAERDPGVVDHVLDSVSAGGRTALLDALYATLAVSASNTPRSLVILFSDGDENASWLSPDSVFDSLKHASVVVYPVVAPTESQRMGTVLMSRIANDSGGLLLRADADSRLAAVFVGILNEFRLRYLLTYTPTGVNRNRDDGWHRISVKLKGKPGRIKARSGHFARAPRQMPGR